ncbi:MAG: transglutaminase domain-containing protein, partial [Proteobacteria bacterium]|nr:transglutaminase domain-containing protein [Pseudomonadota bacterium]
MLKNRPEIIFAPDGKTAGLSVPKTALEIEIIKNNLEIANECSTGNSKYFLDLLFDFHSVSSSTVSSEASLRLRDEIGIRRSKDSRYLTPRSADLYLSILSQLSGFKYESRFKVVEIALADLNSDGFIEKLYISDDPFQEKLYKFRSALLPLIRNLEELDKKKKKRTTETDSGQTPKEEKVPPKQNTSKPGMDELETPQEGEPVPAIWTISPAYGGYFKENTFDTFDFASNSWTNYYEVTKEYYPVEGTNPSIEIITNVSAKIPSYEEVSLPIPSNCFISNVVGFEDAFIDLFEDIYGNFSVINQTAQDGVVTFIFQKKQNTPEEWDTAVPLQIPEITLIGSTKEEFERIKGTYKTDIEKAYALSRYVISHLQYSNDSSFNEIYANDPNGYFLSIDFHRKADCDVANTYYAILCKMMGIRIRHVVGHMVNNKEKDKDGIEISKITSGTGHAWSEVYDNEKKIWVRIDATPAGGDENLQDKRDGEDNTGGLDGDFGREGTSPSEEYLRDLQEATRVIETEKFKSMNYGNKVSTEHSNNYELDEMRRLELYQLPNGERILDVLSSIWDLIVQSSKKYSLEKKGNFSLEQGGEEIDDIVKHYLELRSGVNDPSTRSKDMLIEEPELIFRDIDVYFGLDKSGSMSLTFSGETRRKIQRDSIYLILCSLANFQQNIERNGYPAKVVTCVSSFLDPVSVAIDKQLSSTFDEKQKSIFWRSSMFNAGNNYDAVLYVDSDIILTSEIIEKLFEIDRPLVGVDVPVYGLGGNLVNKDPRIEEHWTTAGMLLVNAPAYYDLPWSHNSYMNLSDDPTFQNHAARLIEFNK